MISDGVKAAESNELIEIQDTFEILNVIDNDVIDTLIQVQIDQHYLVIFPNAFLMIIVYGIL